jgi:hypothetical protein
MDYIYIAFVSNVYNIHHSELIIYHLINSDTLYNKFMEQIKLPDTNPNIVSGTGFTLLMLLCRL